MLEQSHTTLPKLLLHATRDQFCTTKSFDKFVQTLPEPKRAIKICGAHHFDVVRHIPDAFTQWVKADFGAKDLPTFARGDFAAMEGSMPCS